MRYVTATILTIASMIWPIMAGTVARLGMIAALIISDVGMMLTLIAWLGARVW